MKAQKLRSEDNDLHFPPEKITRAQKISGQLPQGKQKEHMSTLKEQLAQKDIEVVRRGLEHLKTRNERIDSLKLLVNANTYQLDSTNIAQKMACSPLARKVLDTKRHTMLAFKDEE